MFTQDNQDSLLSLIAAQRLYKIFNLVTNCIARLAIGLCKLSSNFLIKHLIRHCSVKSINLIYFLTGRSANINKQKIMHGFAVITQ